MMTEQNQHPRGTALPWAAFTLGAAGSLAANLLDAVEAVHRAAHGLPVHVAELSAALFFAAVVPVALLLVVEMLIRSGTTKDGLAVVMWVGAAAVALGAAVMSFGHMFKVMEALGQPPLFAALMPLAVDGLMLVASVALARAGRAATVPEAVPADVPDADEVPESVPADVPPVAAPVPAPVPEAESVPAVAEVVPSMPDLRTAGDVNESARAYVRAALDEGRPVVGRELADLFGKSDRWGRLRIADVRTKADEVPSPA